MVEILIILAMSLGLYVVLNAIKNTAKGKEHEMQLRLQVGLGCFILGLPIAGIAWVVFSARSLAFVIMTLSYTFGVYLTMASLHNWPS